MNGPWKWLATILASMMVGGVVVLYQALNAPSKTQVDRISERQQIVLQRLAVIETRLRANDLVMAEYRRQLEALRRELQHHATSTGSAGR